MNSRTEMTAPTKALCIGGAACCSHDDDVCTMPSIATVQMLICTSTQGLRSLDQCISSRSAAHEQQEQHVVQGSIVMTGRPSIRAWQVVIIQHA